MAKKHVHKYYKVITGGTTLWACGLPDCNHHMPKHYEKMLPGKAFVCWNCGNDGILDFSNMKFEHPFCLECQIDKGIAGFNVSMNSNNNNSNESKAEPNLQYESVNESNKSEVVKLDKKKLDELFSK